MQTTLTEPQLQWLGHSTFKLRFHHEGKLYVVYFDPWFANPWLPDSYKDMEGNIAIPCDADLILISHGHFDHFESAKPLLEASKKSHCKIACIYEIAEHLRVHEKIDESKLIAMDVSGTTDLGFCKITMTPAEHSSSCGYLKGHLVDGGAPAGWVVNLP
jgi:L-ascorbate metabolism protein UlaG (beta-lactamase superfamily)